MKSALPHTLLVIPVENDARTLRGVVEKSLAEGFAVLVVDDGSSDGGLATIADLPVERHRLPVNGGKGAAILAGGALAKKLGYDAILTIDADGRHDPADGRLLLAAAVPCWPAIVIGAGRGESAAAPRSGPFGRDLSRFWVRLECGETLSDSRSGFRLYPVDFLAAGRFAAKRHGFEVEALVRGAWAGLPLLSIPVSPSPPPAGARIAPFQKLRDNLRLGCLHARLVLRSLVPWPHRRMVPAVAREKLLTPLAHPLRFIRQLSREHDSPAELGAAVWVGIFIGALPIIPFGIATIIYVNHRLHLNKLAGVGASNVCCAPFVPLLCIELGHFFRYGRFWTEFNRQTLLHEMHHRLWEWLLGALAVGPLLGLAGAALTCSLVRSLRRRRKANV